MVIAEYKEKVDDDDGDDGDIVKPSSPTSTRTRKKKRVQDVDDGKAVRSRALTWILVNIKMTLVAAFMFALSKTVPRTAVNTIHPMSRPGVIGEMHAETALVLDKDDQVVQSRSMADTTYNPSVMNDDQSFELFNDHTKDFLKEEVSGTTQSSESRRRLQPKNGYMGQVKHHYRYSKLAWNTQKNKEGWYKKYKNDNFETIKFKMDKQKYKYRYHKGNKHTPAACLQSGDMCVQAPPISKGNGFVLPKTKGKGLSKMNMRQMAWKMGIKGLMKINGTDKWRVKLKKYPTAAPTDPIPVRISLTSVCLERKANARAPICA